MSTTYYTSFKNHASSAWEQIRHDAGCQSAASNFILCTAVSGNPIHGAVCASLAFLIANIAKIFRDNSYSPLKRLLSNDLARNAASVVLACGFTRVCLLNPLGITWKVNLLATAIIAVVFPVAADCLNLGKLFFGVSGKNFYDIVPFIPRS